MKKGFLDPEKLGVIVPAQLLGFHSVFGVISKKKILKSKSFI